MGIVVMKFGGTSVGDPERMREVARLARLNAAGGVLVVVSAMSGVTDALFRAAKAACAGDLQAALAMCAELRARHLAAVRALRPEGDTAVETEIASILQALESRLHGVRLLAELSERSMDDIASAGERLSGLLVALAADAPCIDARSVMRTDSRFGEARPDRKAIAKLVADRILPLLGPGKIAVTQGYIGADSGGATTTLGRGGSDYSASLFGAALGAGEIQIWTDVEGILTCDPRVVPKARTVETLGYEEAAELAAYGAKVLHPATIRPALEVGIPVTVRSTLKSDGLFSTISPGSSSGRAAVAIAMRRNVAILSVRQESMTEQSGFLARLFKVFGLHGVSVDLVSTSEICVSVSLDMGEPLEALAADLSELGKVDLEVDRVVVAVVGDMLKETPAVLRKAFIALGDIDVDMVSMGANDINLSLVMKAEGAEQALRRLHAAFFEGDAA
ncbi:MAG: aspartate kinase [Rectinemataceae bacterium]